MFRSFFYMKEARKYDKKILWCYNGERWTKFIFVFDLIV